ncbi:MAG: NAD(P)-dependent oxidoreductase [Balneolales bacterium]
MKVFITGGTGFIGSHLVDLLISNDAEVRCLVRNQEKWLEGKDYTKVNGDMHNLPVLKEGMKDADVVFHTAGLVKAPNYTEFSKINVDATENVVRVAKKSGVKKIVILSSLAAAGPSIGTPLTEDMQHETVSMYGKSKKKMEELIYSLSDEETSITIIRPPAVFGPREDQIYSLFKMASKGFFPIVGKKGESNRISLVYVSDLVEGMMLAANNRNKGVKTYYISSEQTYTWEEIKTITSKVLDKKLLPIYIKPSLAKKVAGAIEQVSSFFGHYPVINRDKANEMTLEWTCSVEKAKKDLAYRQRVSLDAGINKTIKWYKKHNWL